MKLSIALCTYNGSKFLQSQLASFLEQTLLPDEVVVCDDHSTDGTMEILESFARNAPFFVQIHQNPRNLGVRANFLQAIEICRGEFIALSDQDDVWLPHKLQRAHEQLQQCENSASALYFSRLRYVDDQLETLGMSPLRVRFGFPNAIVENVATGCSIVFGAEIRRLLLRVPARRMEMHDWWAYLVACAFGTVIYDDVPSVLYRQHGANVAGWDPQLLKIWKRCNSLVNRLISGNNGMDSLNQAAHFISTYPELSHNQREMVEELLRLRQDSIGARIKYALRPRVFRNNQIENAGLRVMLLMGWH